MKIGFTGMKRCLDGEIYRFKKGRAKVPGMKIGHLPVTITLKEFKNGINKTESRGDA